MGGRLPCERRSDGAPQTWRKRAAARHSGYSTATVGAKLQVATGLGMGAMAPWAVMEDWAMGAGARLAAPSEAVATASLGRRCEGPGNCPSQSGFAGGFVPRRRMVGTSR